MRIFFVGIRCHDEGQEIAECAVNAGRYPGVVSWCDSADWKPCKHCIFKCS